jgi:NADP-dependent 3-hydroxy acid dehydrogenase YdfG
VAEQPRFRSSSDLDGRRAVVTGASSGIGRAIAVALASAGATVYAVARRRDQLDAVAALVPGPGNIAPQAADLCVDTEIADLADRLRARGAGLDILVHCAGTYSRDPVGTARIEDLDRQYRVNVRARYLLTQALLPALRTSRGQIVFINSTVVFAPQANVGQYAATQHALRSLADTLREEINPDGIRVVSVYPGRTATPLQARIHSLEGKPYAPERLLQPADIAEVVLKVLTVPPTVEITDVRVRPAIKG